VQQNDVQDVSPDKEVQRTIQTGQVTKRHGV